MGCPIGKPKTKIIAKSTYQTKTLSVSRPLEESLTTRSDHTKFTIDPKHYVIKRNTAVKHAYKLGQTLGQNQLGCISMASHILSGQARTIKTINKSLLKVFKETENFLNELEFLKALDHPNIIKLFEFYEDDEYFHVIYEYLAGGDMFDYIISQKTLNEPTAIHFAKQILSALCYIHSKGMAHCNLKPESLLLDKTDPLPILKLIDFEHSVHLKNNTKVNRQDKEILYTAPEVFLTDNYSEKSDIWSCGVILYILLSGKPPFSGETDAELQKNIEACHFNLDGPEWSSISQAGKKIVSSMLKLKPGKRISALDALSSPWITGKEQKIIRKESVSLEHLRNFKIEEKIQHTVLNFIASNLLNKEESIRLYHKFKELDLDGDGIISCDELFEIYTKTMSEEDALKEVRKIMESVDANASGVIDYTEFLTACAKREQLMQKKNLEAAFQAFDIDGNGTISKAELIEMLGRVNVEDETIEKIIQKVDLNNDGEIDIEEFQEMMISCWEGFVKI